jgi:hypothetical protein
VVVRNSGQTRNRNISTYRQLQRKKHKQQGGKPTKAPQKHPNVKKVPVKKVETSRKTSAKHPQKPTNDCPEGHTFVKAHCRKNYVKKNKGV